MFKKNTVESLTKEGLQWVDKMEVAALEAEDSAMALEAEAKAVAEQADEARDTASQGRKIVANFRNLFNVE